MADSGSRGRRFIGLLGLGFRRVLGRLSGVEPQRVILAIVGVALAIGLLVTVTGLSLGLSGGTTIESQSVDYWVVPEGGGGTSVAISTSGPKLGDVHDVATRLAADERIRYATPVLIQTVPVENPSDGSREQVLAIGVVPPPETMEIAGLETGSLTPGDPYYNTRDAGAWTGEVVLSDAAAEFLNASDGSQLRAGSTTGQQDLRVVNVSSGDAGGGFAQLPIMVIHLSELQAITGGSESDVADQLLVSTSDPSVEPMLEDLYPGTIVVGKQGIGSAGLVDSGLPLALAATAFLTALGIGALFVATMMGLEIAADRRNLAVLGALGYSAGARSLIVAVETVVVSSLGGILGVGIGFVGILGLNRWVSDTFGVTSVAVVDPLLAVYGIGLAVLIGLLAAPYPILRARRTDLKEVLASGPW